MSEEYDLLVARFTADTDRAMADYRERSQPGSTDWLRNEITEAEYRTRTDALVKELFDRVQQLRSTFDVDMLTMVKPAGRA